MSKSTWKLAVQIALGALCFPAYILGAAIAIPYFLFMKGLGDGVRGFVMFPYTKPKA